MLRIGESVGDPAVIDEITRTLRRAGAAVGASADGVTAMFDPAETTTLFDFDAPDPIGLEQLHATAEKLTTAIRVDFAYPVISVVQLSDTVAISLAISTSAIEFADAPPSSVTTRVTDVWQRMDGRWLAVHEHSSVPADMDSGLAVLDMPVPTA